jgi:hypothetical protein
MCALICNKATSNESVEPVYTLARMRTFASLVFLFFCGMLIKLSAVLWNIRKDMNMNSVRKHSL